MVGGSLFQVQIWGGENPGYVTNVPGMLSWGFLNRQSALSVRVIRAPHEMSGREFEPKSTSCTGDENYLFPIVFHRADFRLQPRIWLARA